MPDVASLTETLVTFEYASSNAHQPHSILFIGGLSDGLATTSYTHDIIKALQGTEWSFFTLNLSSSYSAWGLGHLDRDTDEIAHCLRYIKSYKAAKYGLNGTHTSAKVVLMGHSSGSQDVLHYLYRPNPHRTRAAFDPELVHLERPVVDGAILQAPVSDRDAFAWVLHEGFLGRTPEELRQTYDTLVSMARDIVAQETRYDVVLPIELCSQFGFVSPVSARRFLSLASPDSPGSPSEEDLFSADLSDEEYAKTFGKIKERGLLRGRLMVAPGGKDQTVPDWVDKDALLAKWRRITNHDGKYQIWDEENSGIVPGASHALSDDDQAEPRRVLAGRVLSLLQSAASRA
ncbi:hypothetical protein G7054_g3767 [Neopestalotiopsis clavispora]|nr:hypothetical protein G7054_g3767 [Neopestalotiopsis clavispora]